MQTIDKFADLRCLLAKIDYVLLIKILQKNLTSILSLLSKTAKKLDKNVISLIKIIDIAINTSISKAKLYTRSIFRSDKKFKDTKKRVRRLKKNLEEKKDKK